ncbi:MULTISPECIES: thioesterase family protein [Halomonadaceae]|uniref:acyl-CoA thioesterase n=1 Tax=Halomonadaceae TaxID=28256 RepID=UPI001599AA26|nr:MULTISPECIES: thioesterase family protein [Halomonas]QJQ94772.1 acyl-CoA thioesterase [Halomonas sp. PA5]
MERVHVEFPTEAILHRHALSVRITDMNYGRHLGHDSLISLLHEGRVAALSSLGLNEWDIDGCPSVVADLAVQYQSEARWPDELIVETAIPAPQGKALMVYHRMRRAQDERLVATARVSLLFIDPERGRPVVVPGSLRAALAERGGD